MAATNTEKYSAKYQQMAALAKAVGHPARVAIINQIAKAGSCPCGDIVKALRPLAQPTVSQHLQELKSVGLVNYERTGTFVYYTLDKQVLSRLAKYLQAISEV